LKSHQRGLKGAVTTAQAAKRQCSAILGDDFPQQLDGARFRLFTQPIRHRLYGFQDLVFDCCSRQQWVALN